VRLLVAAVLAAVPLAALAPSASALCGPEEGCSPCPFTIELKPKPHIQYYYC
jgi:hypothetical protein